jgi:hypothetical protein
MQQIRRFIANVDLGEGLAEKGEIFEEYFCDLGKYYPVREGFFADKKSDCRIGLYLLKHEEYHQAITKGIFTEIEPIDFVNSIYAKTFADKWESTLEVLKSEKEAFEIETIKKRARIDLQLEEWQVFVSEFTKQTHDSETNELF